MGEDRLEEAPSAQELKQPGAEEVRQKLEEEKALA